MKGSSEMKNVILYNLPPCPYCGGWGDVMQEYYDGLFGREDTWFVRCHKCGFTTDNVGNPTEASQQWKKLCKEHKNGGKNL